MNRLLLAGALLGLAAALTVFTFVRDGDARLTDLFINLGTEIVGIAMTVAIVDWLIERNKLRDQAQQLAWRMLHELDHVIWVWQGGRREFHLDELVALLDMVQESDPIPKFTEDLMVNLGIRASDALRLQTRQVRINKQLRAGLNCMSGLSRMHELRGVVSPAFVVDSMRQAALALAAVTGQRVHRGAFGVARTFRDSSATSQERRYRGSQHETIKRETGWMGTTHPPSAGGPINVPPPADEADRGHVKSAIPSAAGPSPQPTPQKKDAGGGWDAKPL